jgi:hypothetical protein
MPLSTFILKKAIMVFNYYYLKMVYSLLFNLIFFKVSSIKYFHFKLYINIIKNEYSLALLLNYNTIP